MQVSRLLLLPSRFPSLSSQKQDGSVKSSQENKSPRPSSMHISEHARMLSPQNVSSSSWKLLIVNKVRENL